MSKRRTYTLLVEGDDVWQIRNTINELCDAPTSNYTVRGGVIHLVDVISVSTIFDVVRPHSKCLGVYAVFEGNFVSSSDVPAGLSLNSEGKK